MTSLLVAAVTVTLTVWVVSLIRSVRWRALVYSLPIPITMMSIATPFHVDGGELLGVVALNAFFVVVAVLHVRVGLHIVVADLAGVLVYLGLSRLIAVFEPLPLPPVLAVVGALWAVATVLFPPGPDEAAGPATRLGPMAKLGAAAGGSLLMVAVGRHLKGLVVTFPYSGVLVVLETRHDLERFTRHFTRNSIGLVAFFTACHLLREQGRPAALAAGWLAHALCATALHLGRARGRPPAASGPEEGEVRAPGHGGDEARPRRSP